MKKEYKTAEITIVEIGSDIIMSSAPVTVVPTTTWTPIEPTI